MIRHGEEFKQEAMRIVLTSGLRQIWGGGKSTLNK